MTDYPTTSYYLKCGIQDMISASSSRFTQIYEIRIELDHGNIIISFLSVVYPRFMSGSSTATKTCVSSRYWIESDNEGGLVFLWVRRSKMTGVYSFFGAEERRWGA